MLSWVKYLEKQDTWCKSVEIQPGDNLGLVVIIPSYKEPDIIRTLESLKACSAPDNAVEVIIVVNSPENADADVSAINNKTKQDIKDWKASNPLLFFQTYCLTAEDLPGKHAGAGLARKIGMDEAVRRLELAGKQNGIIISLDADSIVDHNYFTEIEQIFRNNPKMDGCNIYFEHPVSGTDFYAETYEGIAQYELFLRYFVQSLRIIQYPFAFHTIGSAFAVKADAYVRQGGMNKRTAGEDFYFLHKLIPHERFQELNTTTVYPSPRVSDRVPFGTGAAMTKFVNSGEYIAAYHPDCFDELERFMESIPDFYKISGKDALELVGDTCLREFLEEQDFQVNLEEIERNSKGYESFRKRFFQWFNSFRVFKFLNFAHVSHYRKLPVLEASETVLKKMGIIPRSKCSSQTLLLKYREIQKNEQWVVRY